jgi:hypothetical protein
VNLHLEVDGMNTESTGSVRSSGRWRGHADPRAARRSRIWVPIAAAGLILFAALNVYLNLNQDTLPDEVAGVVTFESLPGGVAEGPIDYPQRPPAGGQHAELPHLCGLYHVPLQDEHAVKALATGAVWVAYHPDLPAADVERLRDEASGHLDVILAPYPGLEQRVVLTAWERQLALDSVEDPRITVFIHVYQNNSRAPDVDENCAKGVGPSPS